MSGPEPGPAPAPKPERTAPHYALAALADVSLEPAAGEVEGLPACRELLDGADRV